MPSVMDMNDIGETRAQDRAMPGWRRLAPVLALLVLAPWAAESSWGGIPVSQALLLLVFLGPLYGGAAVLIRETARRAGRGWPTIVLLAAAFGVVQAGLVDQSLFNRGYLADTEYADLDMGAERTVVPGLDVSVSELLAFVGNHVALSICTPIALVECLVGSRRRFTPWLGRRGLAAVAVIYVLGSLLIFSDESGRKGFVASPLQVGMAVVVTAVLVTLAFARRRRGSAGRADEAGAGRADGASAGRADEARSGGGEARAVETAPHPLLVGLVALVGYGSLNLVPGWTGVGIGVGVALLSAVLVVRWSRRAGWEQRHVVAGWGATLAAAAATAWVIPNYDPVSPSVALLSDLTVTAAALALLAGAFLKLRRERAEPDEAAPADVRARRPASPDR